MICPNNGECMMNCKNYTGVDFCVSPVCKNLRKERMVIASEIARLLKKDELSERETREVERLKYLYAKSLKQGG